MAGLGVFSLARRDHPVSSRDADLHVRLVAQPGEVSIWPGTPTRVLHYDGSVIDGDPGALTPVEGSYLGPTFHVRRGQRVRVDFHNRLDEPTTVHWHGLDVPPEMDGHPRNPVAPGGSYRYEFTVLNPAGTYWYHPHPMARTAGQAYAGLAGLVIVSDDAEADLGLPAGERELPLVLQDRRADSRNQFEYPGHDGLEGALGNWLLVNGSVEQATRVVAAPYRLRILNGSNARIYALGWSDGSPLTVIGTDGGLLAEAVARPFAFLAPGERVEVWADFARGRGGDVWLESRSFNGAGGMHGGHGPGMHGRGGALGVPANGAPFPVHRFVVSGEGAPVQPPVRLLDPASHRLDAPPERVRTFTLGLSRGRWLVNGRAFALDEAAPDQVAPDQVMPFGAVEDWEFRTGHMMPVPHPMHVHGPHFRIVSRSRGMGMGMGMGMHGRSGSTGYIDEGWKDTFLMMPGETVRIRLKFEHYRGLYLMHCHNLEHEHGMICNYLIR